MSAHQTTFSDFNEKQIVLDSRNRTSGTSSDFAIDVTTFGLDRNIDKVTFNGGHIPNYPSIAGLIPEPYLILRIPELHGTVNIGHIQDALAVLDFSFGAAGDYIHLVATDSFAYRSHLDLGSIANLHCQILAPSGLSYSFGIDSLNITGCTPANPTDITVSIPHGLAGGDLVTIQNFQNASTPAIRDTIQRQYPVAITGLMSFSIPIDLSGEAAIQPPTGTEAAYQLGRDVQIFRIPQNRGMVPWSGVSSFSLGNPTTISTGGAPHGLTNGEQIRILGFNNGTSQYINSRINQFHNITFINATDFSIPVDLSAQLALQVKTGAQAAYALGQGSNALITKLQTSFILKFVTTRTSRARYDEQRYH